VRPVRLLCAALAVSAAVPGVWAVLAPRGFFASFPGPTGRGWVAELPPFNAHLTSDVGAFYVAFAGLFAWAAARPHPALIVPLAAGWSGFSALHLLFHVTRLDGFAVGDAVGQTLTLLAVLAAGAVLVRIAR